MTRRAWDVAEKATAGLRRAQKRASQVRQDRVQQSDWLYGMIGHRTGDAYRVFADWKNADSTSQAVRHVVDLDRVEAV